MPSQGSQVLWRIASRLVADSSVSTAEGTTADVLVETLPDSLEDTGHSFYTLDVYTKDATVFAFSDSSGIEAPGVFGAHVYVGRYRKWVAGPPASWETYLRFTNLSIAHADPIVVYYKLRRWVGLN